MGEYKGLEIEKQDTELTDDELQESSIMFRHLAEMVVKKMELLKMAIQ